jgi:phosphatidate cytidylyltransferase
LVWTHALLFLADKKHGNDRRSRVGLYGPFSMAITAMLKQRIVTALALLVCFLPALFWHDPNPFCGLMLLLISAGAWEWARLNGYRQAVAVSVALGCAGLCLISWALGWLNQQLPLLWLLAGVAWVLGGGWLLRGGIGAWSTLDRRLRLGMGIAVLWLAWLAAAQARMIGANFLLSVLCLVWVADISAYFSGRRLGGRFTTGKLAPSISPGKTWEGVWGGLAGVLIVALLWRWSDSHWALSVPSLYTHLSQRGLAILIVGVVFLAAMSVVGDLLESLVKRSAGVKDSSGLLPGHGGVLDRLDALLPAMPLAMMLLAY